MADILLIYTISFDIPISVQCLTIVSYSKQNTGTWIGHQDSSPRPSYRRGGHRQIVVSPPSLCFPICKMEVASAPATQGGFENQMRLLFEF